jgi:hypothetical protein
VGELRLELGVSIDAHSYRLLVALSLYAFGINNNKDFNFIEKHFRAKIVRPP